MRLLDFKRFDFFRRKVHLRFEGDYFRTYCGAFAGFTLVLILFVTFFIEVIKIYNGELDKMSYIIKNNNQSMVWTESDIKDGVFGFAVEKNLLSQSGLVELKHGILKGDDFRTTLTSIYNCSERVYRNLNFNSKDLVPLGMDVFCFNTTSDKMNSRYVPYFSLQVCQNSTKGSQKCQSQEKMDKLLKRIEVWIFSLNDQTDFTSPETKMNSAFIAKQVIASNTFSKHYRMYMREVEVHNKLGLIVSRMEYHRTIQFFNQKSEIMSVGKEKEILISSLNLDETAKVEIKKHYKSVGGLMSKIGGLSHGLMIFMFIIVFPVREVLYYSKLINCMFNVCVEPNDVKNAMGITTIVKDFKNQIAIKKRFFNKKKKKMGALATLFRNSGENSMAGSCYQGGTEGNKVVRQKRRLATIVPKTRSHSIFKRKRALKRNTIVEAPRPPSLEKLGTIHEDEGDEVFKTIAKESSSDDMVEKEGETLRQKIGKMGMLQMDKVKIPCSVSGKKAEFSKRVKETKKILKKNLGRNFEEMKEEFRDAKSNEIMKNGGRNISNSVPGSPKDGKKKEIIMEVGEKGPKEAGNEGLDVSNASGNSDKSDKSVVQESDRKTLLNRDNELQEQRTIAKPTRKKPIGKDYNVDVKNKLSVEKKMTPVRKLNFKSFGDALSVQSNYSASNPRGSNFYIADSDLKSGFRGDMNDSEDSGALDRDMCNNLTPRNAPPKRSFFKNIANMGAGALNQLNPMKFFSTRVIENDEELSQSHKELDNQIDQIQKSNKRLKEMGKKLKLRVEFKDFFTFWLRDSVYSSYKTRLYKRGKHMIQQKIDIEYVINSLLELEKMKTLLFDADQYSLFEHIPKPLLFEKKMIDSEEGKSGDKERFLMSHNSSFWNKKNKVLKEKDFIKALERIKAKENPDVIDERLIKLIDDFSS